MARDVLIVLGARVLPSGEPSPLLHRRLLGAVEVARGCPDPLLLVMGGRGDTGHVEADVMAGALCRLGIAPASILVERESRDTLEQARRAAAILADLSGHNRVLVCTSRFHQPRCVLLLRLVGVRAERARMPPDPLRGGVLLRYAAREVAATVWDAGLLCLLRLVDRAPLPTSAQRLPAD
jgi:uncharacterized SAM-binding protein YcdF (DUF218 family)